MRTLNKSVTIGYIYNVIDSYREEDIRAIIVKMKALGEVVTSIGFIDSHKSSESTNEKEQDSISIYVAELNYLKEQINEKIELTSDTGYCLMLETHGKSKLTKRFSLDSNGRLGETEHLFITGINDESTKQNSRPIRRYTRAISKFNGAASMLSYKSIEMTLSHLDRDEYFSEYSYIPFG